MFKKKSLGQNFLNSPQIVDDIVKAGKVEKDDTVLEIGPGEGVMTEKLLQTGAHIISVEKDDRLIPELQKRFVREIAVKQFELIHADILDVGLPHITTGKYKIVANIPYYITGQIIRMFLESDKQPESMTLLVQKEVAERIVTRDGKESLLSLSVKAYGDPKLVRAVGRGAFSPQPNVDSAVLNIENINRERLSGVEDKLFFSVIHAGFAHKRKQLLPNLSSIYSKKEILEAFKICEIDEKARAEDIELSKWVKLCKTL
ncbi:MAG: 16S rRNA (adenine(1518)-N(6)/adenine(1519)-N(6))-dimethyltransferase RsmA [Nitrospira sp.]